MNDAESITDQKGFLTYFRLYFRTASLPSRIFLFACFAVFLITPILGQPGPGSTNIWNSIAVVVGLSVVLVFSSISIPGKNRGQIRTPAVTGTDDPQTHIESVPCYFQIDYQHWYQE